MTLPRLVSTVSELRQLVRDAKLTGKRIGLIPTMGALHAGHLSLVEAAERECDFLVVSLFVNPTQFAPHEDYQRYPRTLEEDLSGLSRHRVNAVFAPSVAEMYPDGYQSYVEVRELSSRWEGVHRPDHFRGVATIVLKLFTAAEPDFSYFGQKDFQQLAIIERLTADLALPIAIRGCPILRDPDGLALSSRNRFLSGAERERGLALSRALAVAGEMARRGERDCGELRAALQEILTQADLQIDYATVVDRTTLEVLSTLDRPAVAILAARVGATRLIDNALLTPPEMEERSV